MLLRIRSAHLGMVRLVSKRWCLLKQRYFCAVYNYAGKADLGKGYWNPKRKLGVTMHFSEIIKLQFGKNSIRCLVFWRFLELLLLNYLYKMRGYPQFCFSIPIALAKICVSRIVINRAKILRYL